MSVVFTHTTLYLKLFALSFFVGGVNLSPLFDNAEFQSSHVQRTFQYLKFWESARENLNQFWFIPSQVMGDHAECIETLARYTLYKNIFFTISSRMAE